MGLDEKLLSKDNLGNQRSGPEDRAGNFRQAVRGNQDQPSEAGPESGSPGDSSEGKVSLLAAAKQGAKMSKNRLKAESLKKMFSQVNALRIATAQLLRQAITLLVKSFGLTFIWVNIHAFFNLAFGKKYFCDLGEEWFIRPGKPAKEKHPAKTIVKIVEPIGCCIINLIIFIIILIILVQIAIMLEIIKDPIGFIRMFGRAILGMVWDAVKEAFSKIF